MNIEFNGYYDNDLSYMYFQDNFETLKEFKTQFGGNEVYIYLDSGQLNNPFEGYAQEHTKIKGTKMNLVQLLKKEFDNVTYKELLKEDRKELERQVFEQLEHDYNLYKDFSLYGANNPYGFGGDELLEKYNLKLEFINDYKKIKIRGYSQGDYAEIYYSPSDIKTLWGKEPNEAELNDMFTNYFYDSPISAKITINDIEYNYDHSTYEWDREEFIKSVEKQSGVAASEFENYIPKTLDYL